MTSTLIEIDDARRMVLERAGALADEPVGLADALGRVLAADVHGADPVPAFDSSAMDGYALRCADVSGAEHAPVALASPASRAAGAAVDGAAGPARRRSRSRPGR